MGVCLLQDGMQENLCECCALCAPCNDPIAWGDCTWVVSIASYASEGHMHGQPQCQQTNGAFQLFRLQLYHGVVTNPSLGLQKTTELFTSTTAILS